MLLAQHISAHEYSAASYSLLCMSAFDLQRIEISFIMDFMISNSLTAAIFGTHVEHTFVENSSLVLDLAVLHLHMRKLSWFLSGGL